MKIPSRWAVRPTAVLLRARRSSRGPAAAVIRRAVFAIDALEERRLLSAFPQILSITRSDPAGPNTNAASVSFAVAFSAPVTGVDASDFALVRTGSSLTTTGPLVVSGAGASFTVTVNGISGSGLLGLKLVDDGSIRGLAGEPLTQAGVPLSFATQQTFASGTGSNFVATADINADGYPDAIVSSTTSSNISVLVGVGDGTFRAAQTFATGALPISVAVADVNGDGKLDVATANFSDNTLSVLLGNGDGAFQGQQTFGAGTKPNSVALADISGDGKPDLIVANYGSANAGVLLGDGHGSFGFQQTFAVGNKPYAVAVGDVSGDGTADLVVSNSTDNTLSVLRGNGNGTFTNQMVISVGLHPQSIALTDTDGDSHLDIITTNTLGNNISVVRSVGGSLFLNQQTFLAGSNPISVAAADVNGDNKPDLVIVNGTNNVASVLLGNGDGAFQFRQTFAAGSSPQSVAVADVNADGRPDLLLANLGNSSTSVVLANGNANFTGELYGIVPSVRSFTRNNPAGPNVAASSVTFTLTFNTPVTGVDATDFRLENGINLQVSGSTVVAGRGALYTVTVNGLSGTGNLDLVLQDNGSIRDMDGRPLVQPSAPVSFFNANTSSVGAGPKSAAATDINGDGKADLVVANFLDNNVSVLLGNGDGSFQTQQTFAADSGPNSVVIADVNGDGRPDVITANQSDSIAVLLANGTGTMGNGTFGPPILLAPGVTPGSIAVADLNLDGSPDLAVVNPLSTTASVILGNGNGTFKVRQTFATGSVPGSLALVDVNNDNNPDLLIANFGTNGAGNTASVLLGNGDGTFQPQQAFTTGGGPVAIAAVDVNGDGAADLITANQTDGNVSVLLGNGDGTFQAHRTYSAPTPAAITVADVNGDAKLDLIVTSSANNTGVLLGNGDGKFQARQTFSVGPDPRSVVAADVNGDGRKDLIIATYNTVFPMVSVLLNSERGDFSSEAYTFVNGVQSITRTTPPGPSTSASTVAWTVTFQTPVTGVDASDFLVTGTGAASVSSLPVVTGSGAVYTVTVSGISGSGTVTLNLVDDSTIRDAGNNPLVQGSSPFAFQARQTFAAGNAPNFVATADVNGDGKPDLILANYGASSVSVLLGNGNGTFQNQQTFATGANPDSVVAADVNGDTFLDLVTSNYSSNNVSVLLGNGDGTFQAQRSFATGAQPSALAVADVNGNTNLDIVVVNRTSNTASVLLGNGDGTFVAQKTFAVGRKPTSVTLADVNFDSKPDLISTSTMDGTVSISLGSGTNGQFLARTTFAAGTQAGFVTTADVNGDGTRDLIVANYGGGSVSILLGNGSATFQPQQTYATGSSPNSIAVADVNGDGSPDLTVADFVGSTLSVLPGQNGGTFLARQTLAAGTAPASVVATDLNADGRPDLVVASPSGVENVLLSNTNGSFTGEAYIVAPAGVTLPTVQSITGTNPAGPIVTGNSVTYTVTFIAPVTGVDATDFNLVLTGATTATTPVVVSGSGAVYTVTVSGISGVGTLALNLVNDNTIAGLAAEPLGSPSFTGSVYQVVAPTVQSITGTSPGGTSTAANSVTYTVTFSAPVTGVDATDFALALAGATTATTPVVVSGSGAVYTVTVNGIAGAGTLGLNLLNNGSVVGLASQPLSGGTFTGSLYQVVPPTIQSVTGTTPAGPNVSGTSVTYTVTFSGPVTGVDATDFAVSFTGTVTATTPVVVTGSGAVFSVTVNGISGAGTLRLHALNDGSIVGLTGLALSGPSVVGSVYQVVAPVVQSITRTSPAGPNTAAGNVSYTVTFNAPVTGVDATDFALAVAGNATAATPVVVSGSGAVYTVTVDGIAITGLGTLGLNLLNDGSIMGPTGQALAGGTFTGAVYQLSPVAVESVTLSPNPVLRGNKLTAIANNVTATAGEKIRSVTFFIDTNNNGAFNKGDILLGTDNSAAGGFAVTKPLKMKMALGTLTISAVATGARGKTDVSPAVTGTVTVADVPPVFKKLVSAPAKVKAAGKVSLIASGLSDKDGAIAQVSFFRDSNQNGVLDIGTDVLLGTDLTRAGGFKIAIAPNTFSAGLITLFAQATDNDGLTSGVVTGVLRVT